MPYTRISLTIPAALLRELDKRAKSHGGRARSRLVAEAIRSYLGGTTDSGTAAQQQRVAEKAWAPYQPAFAQARLDLLKANLALSPAQRLKQAENLLLLTPRRARRHQVLGFDSYDEYYEWKKTRNVR